MQRISYHGGHSGELCAHAQDTKELLIQSYIDRGFTHLGVTEHLAPASDAFLYPDETALGYDAAFLNQRLEKYFKQAAPRLRKKFGSQINLLLGFETEFYGEQPIKIIQEAISKYSPEIIVASIHHVKDIPVDFDKSSYQQAIETCGSLDRLYLEYYRHQLELIEFLTGYTSDIPIVLGHMDLIKIFSAEHKPSSEVFSQIEKNIGAAVTGGFAFEINARAFKKGLAEPYPGIDLIERIRNQGGRFTLGDDSHAVEEVGLYYDKLENSLAGKVETLAVVEKDGNSGYQWVDLPLEEQ
jgi:histidinol-phosphatase (PHP family)